MRQKTGLTINWKKRYNLYVSASGKTQDTSYKWIYKYQVCGDIQISWKRLNKAWKTISEILTRIPLAKEGFAKLSKSQRNKVRRISMWYPWRWVLCRRTREKLEATEMYINRRIHKIPRKERVSQKDALKKMSTEKKTHTQLDLESRKKSGSYFGIYWEKRA